MPTASPFPLLATTFGPNRQQLSAGNQSMALRDDIEKTLRAWNAHEINRGAPATVDFDCFPRDDTQIEPAASRLAIYRRITELQQQAERLGEPWLARRLIA